MALGLVAEELFLRMRGWRSPPLTLVLSLSAEERDEEDEEEGEGRSNSHEDIRLAPMRPRLLEGGGARLRPRPLRRRCCFRGSPEVRCERGEKAEKRRKEKREREKQGVH